jgi:hypothetical protein
MPGREMARGELPGMVAANDELFPSWVAGMLLRAPRRVGLRHLVDDAADGERSCAADALMQAAVRHLYAVGQRAAEDAGGGSSGECGGSSFDDVDGDGCGRPGTASWPYDEPCREPLFAALGGRHQFGLISEVLVALSCPAGHVAQVRWVGARGGGGGRSGGWPVGAAAGSGRRPLPPSSFPLAPRHPKQTEPPNQQTDPPTRAARTSSCRRSPPPSTPRPSSRSASWPASTRRPRRGATLRRRPWCARASRAPPRRGSGPRASSACRAGRAGSGPGGTAGGRCPWGF